MFEGIPFDDGHPYSYEEAKNVLRKATTELRMRKELHELGVEAEAPGRDAITGKEDRRVWDVLPIRVVDEPEFTKNPHLTLGILDDCVEATITLPNAIDTSIRHRIADLGTEGFRRVIGSVVDGMADILSKSPGAVPWGRAVQRRYPSQRSIPFVDAMLQFDLRTAFEAEVGPKLEPIWLRAAYEGYTDRKGPNIQLQIGMRFPYRHCPELKSRGSVDLIVAAWVAAAPLLDVARGNALPA